MTRSKRRSLHTMHFKEETRGPNYATFHVRHVSDSSETEELGEFGLVKTEALYTNQSDDEQTKKRTPRFEKEPKGGVGNLQPLYSSNLQPQYSRKLTYSAEDVKRLAAEAEQLVLRRRKRRVQGSGSDVDRIKREWRKSLPCRLEKEPRPYRLEDSSAYQETSHPKVKDSGCSMEAEEEEEDGSSSSCPLSNSVDVMTASSDSFVGSIGELVSPDKGYESLHNSPAPSSPSSPSSAPSKTFPTCSPTTNVNKSETVENSDENNPGPVSSDLGLNLSGLEEEEEEGEVDEEVEPLMTLETSKLEDWSLEDWSTGSSDLESTSNLSSEDAPPPMVVAATAAEDVFCRRRRQVRRSAARRFERHSSFIREDGKLTSSSGIKIRNNSSGGTSDGSISGDQRRSIDGKEAEEEENGRLSVQSSASSHSSGNSQRCGSSHSSGSSRSNYSARSNISSQLWEKEDYLPEVCYSEGLDEEGLNTLLSLGEDFSNLNHTMEYKNYLGGGGEDYLLWDEDYSQIIRNKDDISSDLSDFNDNDDNLSDLSDLDANQDHHGAPAEDHDHGHDPGHNHGQDHDREVSSGNGPTRRLDTDGAGSSNSAPSDRKLSPKKKKKKKKKSDTSEEIHQSELEETKNVSRRRRRRKAKGKSADLTSSSLVTSGELKVRIVAVHTILQEIILSNRSSLERDESGRNGADTERTKKEQGEVLFKLKREIFDLNLAVHSLQQENRDKAEVGRLLEDVVQLYSLLRQAKDFNCQETAVNTDEDADFIVGGEGVKAKKDGAFVAHKLQIDSTTPTKVKLRRKKSSAKHSTKAEVTAATSAGGGGITGVVTETGWISLVGRVCMYSCFLAAALLPMAAYSQARCCEHLNYYNSAWIHFQYTNGPPPI